MVDWTIYKAITLIPRTNLTAQLHSACESSVQNSLISAVPNLLEFYEELLFLAVESIVTYGINPAVNEKDFYTLRQDNSESIQDFVL